MQQAALFRRERQVGYCSYCGYWSFGFCGSSASSARSAGDIGVSSVQYWLSTLACLSPADSADHAEECSKAALFRRERQLGEVNVVLWFCGLSAWICEICERYIGVSLFADWLSPLACYSPADYADYAEECSKLHYFADKDRLGFVWLLRVIVVLGFVCVICEICGRHWVFSLVADWVLLCEYSLADR